MAHNNLVDGTSYATQSGKCLVDGTGYSIQKGRTLVDGTGYDISFFAGTALADIAVGSIIKLNENGELAEFYVAKHDYESGLNGAGRTLVVRKDCYDTRAWHSSNVNAYASSDIDTWFNSTYKALLDADIQEVIGTTKFYYTPGNGSTSVTTLTRAIFALSATELGKTATYANTEGTALSIASTLQIAYRNGSAVTQWTRSPNTNFATRAYFLTYGGGVNYNLCTYAFGSRPAFTLPSTALFNENMEFEA